MQAEKLIIETGQNGQLKKPLHLSPNTRFEAIFLVLDEKKTGKRRKLSPKITGKGKIIGDIMQPVIPSENGEAVK